MGCPPTRGQNHESSCMVAVNSGGTSNERTPSWQNRHKKVHRRPRSPFRPAAIVHIRRIYRCHLAAEQSKVLVLVEDEPVVEKIFVIEEAAIGSLIVQSLSEQNFADFRAIGFYEEYFCIRVRNHVYGLLLRFVALLQRREAMSEIPDCQVRFDCR